MLKLDIFNMKEFIKTVNQCSGPVWLHYGGEKIDLNKNDLAQDELQCRHNENGGCVPLDLTFSNSKDYFKMVISFVATPL